MDLTRRDWIKTAATASAGLLVPQVLIAEPIEIIKDHSVKGLSRIPDELNFDRKLLDILALESNILDHVLPRELDTIIVHTTEHALGPASRSLENIAEDKAANYFLDQRGRIYEVIPPDQKSEGAGNSVWNGVHKLNGNSINVELFANVIREKYYLPVTDRQYTSLGRLIKYLQKEIPTIKQVLGHNQVAVYYFWEVRESQKDKLPKEFVGKPFMYRDRKQDPGFHFRWKKVMEQNPYYITDPDILSGRVKMPAGVKRLPGQREAEQLLKEKQHVHVLP